MRRILVQISRDNLKWAGRAALILVLVAATDCLAVAFVRRPPVWYLIPALLPLLICVFVVVPLATRAGKPADPNA
ncbi:MAG: hypothetical protein ABSD67_15915 [Terracidiphilus sp.]|jgi:peptidoglycan/LPS O-acetylase OafA/YrhL